MVSVSGANPCSGAYSPPIDGEGTSSYMAYTIDITKTTTYQKGLEKAIQRAEASINSKSVGAGGTGTFSGKHVCEDGSEVSFTIDIFVKNQSVYNKKTKKYEIKPVPENPVVSIICCYDPPSWRRH